MQPRDYERIFVLTHEGVGDLVFVMPTLYALKENLPDAKIQLAVSRVQKYLASTLEGKSIETLHAHDHGFATLFRGVRQFKPDLYFEFDGGLRYAVAGLFSSAARRIHPPPELVKPYAALLHAESLPLNVAEHRVDTLMSLLDLLGLPKKKISFEFKVPDQHIERAASVAERYIPRGSIAFVPISGHRCKDWPAESLQRTINILSGDLGRDVVLIGRDPFPGVRNATDLAGKSDFLTDAYLLRYSGLFDVTVGVDTGMMHIAGAISSDTDGSYAAVSGNRTVSLFGPTESSIYKPYDPTGTLNVVVKPKKKSSAMGCVGWAGDTLQRPYMKEIDPAEIVGSVVRHLAAKDLTVSEPPRELSAAE